MDIKINLKIFLFIAIFYLTGQIEIYGIFMLFAFLHELGHLSTGVIMGFRPKTLNIMPVGLSISFSAFPKDYNKKILKSNAITLKKLLIAMAGPITNIVIAVVIYYTNIDLFGVSKSNIIYANILIALFNLIPIYPLDGGRIFKYICRLFMGFKKSFIYTNNISNITITVLTMLSSVAIYYYKNIAFLFIILYLWLLVIIENRKYKMRLRMYKVIEDSNTYDFKEDSKDLKDLYDINSSSESKIH